MSYMMKIQPVRGLLLACATLCSCVSSSVPSHGGGKRFAYEQEIIASSVDVAIQGLDFGAIPVDNPIDLFVIGMGEDGAEILEGSSSPLAILGPLSFLFLGPLGFLALSSSGSGQPSGSHAFSNSPDIEFVRSKILQAVAEEGIPIASGTRTATSVVGGTLYILVSELGTAKEKYSVAIYHEDRLSARVAMEAFFVPTGAVAGAAQEYVPLGEGECTTEYNAAYVFGGVPVRSTTITTTPGAIPARIVVNDSRKGSS